MTSQKEVNPVMGGWLGYYTAFYPNAVTPLCHRIDRHLVRWARWKYKRLERSGPPSTGVVARGPLKGTRAVRALEALQRPV